MPPPFETVFASKVSPVDPGEGKLPDDIEDRGGNEETNGGGVVVLALLGR
jgi:hypothetical protein